MQKTRLMTTLTERNPVINQSSHKNQPRNHSLLTRRQNRKTPNLNQDQTKSAQTMVNMIIIDGRDGMEQPGVVLHDIEAIKMNHDAMEILE